MQDRTIYKITAQGLNLDVSVDYVGYFLDFPTNEELIEAITVEMRLQRELAQAEKVPVASDHRNVANDLAALVEVAKLAANLGPPTFGDVELVVKVNGLLTVGGIKIETLNARTRIEEEVLAGLIA